MSNLKKLISLSTDRLLFKEGSAVRARIIEYAKGYEEMHIIVASDKSFKEAHIAPNIWIYPTRSAFKALYPLDMMRLGRFIIERRGITDITCQDPFLTGMAGISLKKRFDLPLELQVHTDIGSPNFPYSLSNKIRKALALSYLPKADMIRVVSSRIAGYLIRTIGIPESKITVRPIAVDTEKIKNAPVLTGANLREKYPQFDKIVLMASRLEPEKKIELAIGAWPAVLEKMPKAGLVIVGRGSQEEKLKKTVSRLGLERSVVFCGWADMKTLYSYLKTADIFLNASLFEGYGMALVEAKAAGCKIVSTDVGVAKEIGAGIVDWNVKDVSRGIEEAFAV